MPFDLPDADAKRLLELYQQSGSAPQYVYIGAFVCHFSVAELLITILLSRALQMPNFQTFSYLTRGLDAKAKIERLFGAEPGFVSLGPHLVARLERFKSVSIPIRNYMTHSWNHIENDILHFASVDLFRDSQEEYLKALSNATRIHLSDLGREITWMQMLGHDLSPASITPGQTLEIIAPKSNLPRSGHPNPLRKAPRAQPPKKKAKKIICLREW